MDVKLFFRLTKFGWINLFYGPAMAVGLYFASLEMPGAWFAPCLIACGILASAYIVFEAALGKPSGRTAMDFLVLAPLAFAIAQFALGDAFYLARIDFGAVRPILPAIGALYGVRFAVMNFSSYEKTLEDYRRITKMLDVEYRPSLISMLDSGAPCERDLAKELRRKYAHH